MIEHFKTYQEFNDTYKQYLNHGGLFYQTVIMIPEKPRSFFDKLFNNYTYAKDCYSLVLNWIIKVNYLCPMIEKIEIEYRDNDGEIHKTSANYQDIFHYVLPETIKD